MTRRQISSDEYDVGDLIAVEIDQGWVVCELIQKCPDIAAWGDSHVTVAPYAGIVCQQSELLPSAGALIGKWFGGVEELKSALMEHLSPQFLAEQMPATASVA